MKKQRIAVAYSGGLDTSVIVKWLQEKYNAEVITVTGNLGQKKELTGVPDLANNEQHEDEEHHCRHADTFHESSRALLRLEFFGRASRVAGC